MNDLNRINVISLTASPYQLFRTPRKGKISLKEVSTTFQGKKVNIKRIATWIIPNLKFAIPQHFILDLVIYVLNVGLSKTKFLKRFSGLFYKLSFRRPLRQVGISEDEFLNADYIIINCSWLLYNMNHENPYFARVLQLAVSRGVKIAIHNSEPAIEFSRTGKGYYANLKNLYNKGSLSVIYNFDMVDAITKGERYKSCYFSADEYFTSAEIADFKKRGIALKNKYDLVCISNAGSYEKSRQIFEIIKSIRATSKQRCVELSLGLKIPLGPSQEISQSQPTKEEIVIGYLRENCNTISEAENELIPDAVNLYLNPRTVLHCSGDLDYLSATQPAAAYYGRKIVTTSEVIKLEPWYDEKLVMVVDVDRLSDKAYADKLFDFILKEENLEYEHRDVLTFSGYILGIIGDLT
jgi:hypothetical protein